jgi:S-adenosylmethionine uptake transporter
MLLAAIILDERIGPESIAGSVAAFAGVVVIVLGQARSDVAQDVLLGIGAIIASALCYAVNIVLMRQQALKARPLEINFFQSVTVMVLWLLAVPFAGPPAWPGEQWMWVAIACLLSTSGTLLFAWGYARGPASYLAATEYSGFLWASVLGWLAFRERVSLYTLGGAALIVGGCLIAARGRVSEPPEIDVAV